MTENVVELQCLPRMHKALSYSSGAAYKNKWVTPALEEEAEGSEI